MKSTRVLVTGTGSCGVGEGIYKCLAFYPELYEVHAANEDIGSVALYRATRGHLLPRAGDPRYVDAVRQLCTAENIPFVIPGSEPELAVLARHAEMLREAGLLVLCNPPSVIDIGDDKWVTASFLLAHGIATPISFDSLDDEGARTLGFPLIAKPKQGNASKNVFVVKSQDHLHLVRQIYALGDIDGMLQQYIGADNSEFTASALLTMDGELIGSFAARRTLIGGATRTVEVDDFPEVRRAAEEVARVVGARGPINIQARVQDGRVVVFEINPRFSGSAPFRALAGFNEAHLLLQAILEGTAAIPFKVKTGTFGVRGFEEVLVDDVDRATVARWPR